MASVAASFTSIWAEALIRPGDTERDLGLRDAESLRSLGPLAGPSLQHLNNLRMREEIRQAVVSQAELQSGRLPGAQTVTVGFVDIVGFTELGEEVPPSELGPWCATLSTRSRMLPALRCAWSSRSGTRRCWSPPSPGAWWPPL